MSIQDNELLFASPAETETLPDFLPEKHMRAVIAAVGLTVAMLLVLALTVWMPKSSSFSIAAGISRLSQLSYLLELQQILFPCLIGCAVYLLAPYKRWGYRAAAIACVIVAIPVSIRLIYSLLLVAPTGQLMLRVFNLPSVRFTLLYQALSAAGILGAGFIITALWKTSKRVIVAGGVSAVLGFILSFIGKFMPLALSGNSFGDGGSWTWFGHGPDFTSNMSFAHQVMIVLYFITSSALIVLSAWLVNSLCTMKNSLLKTGPGAKIWFCIVFALYGFFLFNNIKGDSFNPVSFALYVILMLGLVLMFIHKRVGWHIYLIGIGLTLALTIPGAVFSLLDSAAELGITSRIPAFLGYSFHVSIPFIIWRVIRKGWRDEPPRKYVLAP